MQGQGGGVAGCQPMSTAVQWTRTFRQPWRRRKNKNLHESKCGGREELRGLSQWGTVQLCTWSPNKLWRSNSIFNLCSMSPCLPLTRTFRQPWRRKNTSPNAGGGRSCGVSAKEYSCTHGAQIIFRDLTPYLTYAPSLPLTRTFRQPWRRRWNRFRFLVLLLDPDLVVRLHQQLLLRLDVHVPAPLLVSFTRVVYLFTVS